MYMRAPLTVERDYIGARAKGSRRLSSGGLPPALQSLAVFAIAVVGSVVSWRKGGIKEGGLRTPMNLASLRVDSDDKKLVVICPIAGPVPSEGAVGDKGSKLVGHEADNPHEMASVIVRRLFRVAPEGDLAHSGVRAERGNLRCFRYSLVTENACLTLRRFIKPPKLIPRDAGEHDFMRPGLGEKDGYEGGDGEGNESGKRDA